MRIGIDARPLDVRRVLGALAAWHPQNEHILYSNRAVNFELPTD
jgi:hypothetical protein